MENLWVTVESFSGHFLSLNRPPSECLRHKILLYLFPNHLTFNCFAKSGSTGEGILKSTSDPPPLLRDVSSAKKFPAGFYSLTIYPFVIPESTESVSASFLPAPALSGRGWSPLSVIRLQLCRERNVSQDHLEFV